MTLGRHAYVTQITPAKIPSREKRGGSEQKQDEKKRRRGAVQVLAIAFANALSGTEGSVSPINEFGI